MRLLQANGWMAVVFALGLTGCGGTDVGAPAATGPAASTESFDVRFQESRFYREQDLFLPEDRPTIVPANEATFLTADDEVFGLVVNGLPRAYSVRMLCYHHVVNDRFGDVPVVVTY